MSRNGWYLKKWFNSQAEIFLCLFCGLGILSTSPAWLEQLWLHSLAVCSARVFSGWFLWSCLNGQSHSLQKWVDKVFLFPFCCLNPVIVSSRLGACETVFIRNCLGKESQSSSEESVILEAVSKTPYEGSASHDMVTRAGHLWCGSSSLAEYILITVPKFACCRDGSLKLIYLNASFIPVCISLPT